MQKLQITNPTIRNSELCVCVCEAIMGFAMPNTNLHHTVALKTRPETNSSPKTFLQQGKSSSYRSSNIWFQNEERDREKRGICRAGAFADWPLLAVTVEHVEGLRDFVVHKSVFHLNDEAIKNVYTMYIMFTCWGCCFFGSTKDPYYDSEEYRKDGGDGTGFWLYQKQEDVEEAARAELWREELIEEIEQKVGGLRELEEAGKKQEELVK